MIDPAAYRPFARFIARRYFLPGGDVEDLEQEAMLGLFYAMRNFRPDGGASFHSFARLCMERQVITAVKTATRLKHGPLNDAVRDRVQTDDGELSLVDVLPAPGSDPAEIIAAREEALELLRAITHELTPLERRALIGFVNGESYREIAVDVGGDIRQPDGSPRHKRVENALIRARRKLGLVPTTELQAAA